MVLNNDLDYHIVKLDRLPLQKRIRQYPIYIDSSLLLPYEIQVKDEFEKAVIEYDRRKDIATYSTICLLEDNLIKLMDKWDKCLVSFRERALKEVERK